MRPLSALAAPVAAILMYGQAWGGPAPASPTVGSRDLLNPQPVSASSDSAQAARRINLSAAYREHAPLAWFSLGSLAVGGVFYAIGRGLDRPNVSYAAGSRSQMATAVALAGAGAMLAAGSYFYYVHKAVSRSNDGDGEVSDWEAAVSGAPDGAGGFAVSARLSIPLPSLP